MRKEFLWMHAAILTICGTMLLTSCSDDIDHPSKTLLQNQLTEDVWYVEYDEVGTFNYEGQQVTYTCVKERYAFNEDGTGIWSRYYMGDPAMPVAVVGGLEDGEFHYAVNPNGTVDIFPKNSKAVDITENRTLRMDDNSLIAPTLSAQKRQFSEANPVLADAFNEWDKNDQQVSNGNANAPQDGLRMYGVGYGYNFILDHSKALSTAPIIEPQVIADSSKTNGIDIIVNEKTYTGSSMTEVSNQFSANVEAGGGLFGFKGEVGAAFTKSTDKTTSNEYALTICDFAVTTATLEGNEDFVRRHMKSDFKAALLGLTSEYKGREGLKKLVKNYGTHCVGQVRLGGRLRYACTVDVSKVSGEYDLDAYAKVSYSKLSFSASASVDNKYKQAYESNNTAITTTITAIGGTVESVAKLTGANSNKEAIDEWKNSLKDRENDGVVEVLKAYPLWELIPQDTEENKQRASDLESYIKDGSFEDDMTNKDVFMVGGLGKIEVDGIFTDDDVKNGTLVKDLRMNKQVVIARACLEYVPQINLLERSLILYPVIENKPKYNLGYFVGSSTVAPCRVSWNDKSAAPNIIKLTREKTGRQKVLYQLGCSFLHSDIDQKTIKTGVVNGVFPYGAYMRGPKLVGKENGKDKIESSYNYPLVKIFNHVWTRENFNYPLGDGSVTQTGDDNQVFYSHKMISSDYNRNKLPNGWRLPNKTMINQLKEEMIERGLQRPADQLVTGGPFGFDATWLGYIDTGLGGRRDKDKNFQFWSIDVEADGTDKFDVHHYVMLDKETGNMDITQNPAVAQSSYYIIRLVEGTYKKKSASQNKKK